MWEDQHRPNSYFSQQLILIPVKVKYDSNHVQGFVFLESGAAKNVHLLTISLIEKLWILFLPLPKPVCLIFVNCSTISHGQILHCTSPVHLQVRAINS